MRLIDADMLGLTDMEIIMCDGDYKEALKMLIDKIEHAPTIELMRKKGRWKRRLVDSGFNADWHCSECGWQTALEEHGYNFCPNCGTDMRGKQDDR